MSGPLEIAVQGTPNPNAAKFTLNRVVATQGTTYRLPALSAIPSGSGQAGAPNTTAKDAAQEGATAEAGVEWAKQLLALPGVTQLFAINNFISVTKTPEGDWNVLAPQVEDVLRRVFQ